jgi:hypothetical protein
VDGFIAKRFNQKSVVGSFLGALSLSRLRTLADRHAALSSPNLLRTPTPDPLADKLLMTIMVTTMAYKALLPCT